VQMSTLPARMPVVAGYNVCALFEPAELTGGDTYDLALLDQGLLVVLGDATGHGIAPALSVTQMHAMLRIAFRMGADLETAFIQINNRLAETLADDRFITAFVGLLDPATHRLRFHSGGQGPIFRYVAVTGGWERHKPTSFPLGAMPIASLRPAIVLDMQPGDILVLLSDGFYEQSDPHGEMFGDDRVRDIVRAHHAGPMADMLAGLLRAVGDFAGDTPQQDDMTAVVVKRDSAVAKASVARTFDSLPALVAFTAEAFARLQIDDELLPAVDFVVEELFTNMVKYATGSDAAVEVGVMMIDDGVELTLVDRNVEPFDVTRAPEVDIDAPIAQRTPGGLGLHLIRRMADSVEYEYKTESRRSLTTVRMTSAGMAARSRTTGNGGGDVRN
jgi:anti-sigma regulatory factor (Ser/Thr protein kinase)